MRMWSYLVVSVIVLGGVNAAILPAKAEEVCKVTDPTGTPLNVRDVPNGRIINQLKNGKEVYILEITDDNKRRP
jgi:hypothetical protein